MIYSCTPGVKESKIVSKSAEVFWDTATVNLSQRCERVKTK